jgi:hypothetical protein
MEARDLDGSGVSIIEVTALRAELYIDADLLHVYII